MTATARAERALGENGAHLVESHSFGLRWSDVALLLIRSWGVGTRLLNKTTRSLWHSHKTVVLVLLIGRRLILSKHGQLQAELLQFQLLMQIGYLASALCLDRPQLKLLQKTILGQDLLTFIQHGI